MFNEIAAAGAALAELAEATKGASLPLKEVIDQPANSPKYGLVLTDKEYAWAIDAEYRRRGTYSFKTSVLA